MNILILGSEGFIGKHCVQYFIAQNYSVYGTDLFEQPTNWGYNYIKASRLSPNWDQIFNNQDFNLIINCSGSGNVPYSMTHPLSDFEANTLDTIRILDSIRQFQPKAKYLHLSSAAVYGNPSILPIKETNELSPLSPYGWHKLMSEQICTEYSNLFGLKIAIVRPFSVYGPGLKKQLFWDLFHKTRNSPEKLLELHGTGQESRDFIFIKDLITAFDCILKRGNFDSEVYNLASGKETTIQEAVNEFFSLLKIESGFYFNQKVRPGDPLNWKADIQNIQSLGFEPKYNLQVGLKELTDWLNNITA